MNNCFLDPHENKIQLIIFQVFDDRELKHNCSNSVSNNQHSIFLQIASFEVTVNGQLVFSKLKKGGFPVFKEVSIKGKYQKLQRLCHISIVQL